ncbi:MAG: hypothetical protein WD627_10775 [Actinomycetota bacterium]
MNVSAIIELAEPERLLTWRGHVLATWFFEGYRKFAIQPMESAGASVTHVEDIHGLFAPVFGIAMGGAAKRSHGELNEALRSRAENPGYEKE